jgi:hypothetical protein
MIDEVKILLFNEILFYILEGMEGWSLYSEYNLDSNCSW